MTFSNMPFREADVLDLNLRLTFVGSIHLICVTVPNHMYVVFKVVLYLHCLI